MFIIGRWIRYVRRRAVLLGSWRRGSDDLWRWIKLEMVKSMVVIFLMTLPDQLGWYDTPLFIGLAAIAVFFLYNAVFTWHAVTTYSRLDKRRIAKLESLGCPMPDFRRARSSKTLWKSSLSGMTARQLIKDKALMAEYYKEIGHKSP